MNVLVTGNRGYIGPILVDMLLAKKYKVTGYDAGYYDGCELYPYTQTIHQIKKDIRDIEERDLKGIDAVIHLAALSNDPLGELAPGLTEEINFKATMKLAKYAKKMGVRRFIYSSSQSMYGVSVLDVDLEEDNSEKNPLTVYASTKWQAECALKEMGDKDFHVVCFRPSTVFGASPVLRCDIVFNNLVACAYTTGKIEIKSDGTPWRPVVHVRDVSNAYIAGLEAPLDLVSGQAFNVGIPNGNFTVRDLAQAAQRSVPGSTLIFTGEHGKDSRTYRVSFKKILTQLKNYFNPEWNLDRGGAELVECFKKVGLTEDDFRGRKCTRLKQIHYLSSVGKLNRDLRWIQEEPSMPDKDFKTIQECRGCFSANLVDILDLGMQPLANALVKDKQEEIRQFPLTTAFCTSCCLFQLKETIRKEILFDSYLWVTGTSQAAKQYARTFAERIVKLCELKPREFVLEIASNDGTILKQFMENNCQVLGVEPAENIASMAEQAGIKTLCAYWNKATAQNVVNQYGQPKVCIARNVIPHVSELHEVIQGIYDVLDDEGVGVIEFHDGGIILRELHYDSIYHEHLCYFTLKSITNLLNRYNLYPFHVDLSPISGGSYVIYFSKKQRPQDATYLNALHKEESSHTNDEASWKNFAQKVFEHKQRTLQLVSSFKNRKIIGFGASARSSTYLNYCKLNSSQIDCIIDNNCLKQGLSTAGSNIPIISKEMGLLLNPDLLFILAWNFKDEIINECKAAGFKGQYLVMFPEKS